MILRKALISITRQLDIISRENDQSISSNNKLKAKGLDCLTSLVEDAPQCEFKKFIESEDYDILLGYLLNVLCNISKNDKSRNVRSGSLKILNSLSERIRILHDERIVHEKCCIKPIISALPGVSSSLFRLIMSDTKLPTNLLVGAIKCLASFLTAAFLSCDHGSKSSLLDAENLAQTCDNIAIRFGFLVDYILNQSSNLSQETKYEVLELCDTIVTRTRIDLIHRTLKSIIRYTAFLSKRAEIQPRIVLIGSHLQEKLQSSDKSSHNLQSTALSCLFELLDNLENHHATMLIEERESELSILSGFLRLLPGQVLTILFEINERRAQFLHIMTKLAEFSTQQPFLFLTDSKIGEEALENSDERIYTVEKRFSHLSSIELELIEDCLWKIGQSLDWFCIEDMFRNELSDFKDAGNLFVTHLLLKGCIDRFNLDTSSSRFAMSALNLYNDQTHEKYLKFKNETASDGVTYSKDVLEIVIGIETSVTLVEIYLKSQTKSSKIVILKRLLCMLLNWTSSCSRAISEASVNSLTRLSALYECISIKSLIETNIDYVVDGVNQLLEDFTHNSEVTSVLATALKLSSIDTLYYFQDIYERVFKILGNHHHTKRSEKIALLFYRTLSILCEWKEAKEDSEEPDKLNLYDLTTLEAIRRDLCIERRLKKLSDDVARAKSIRQRIDHMDVTEEDECKLIDDIRNNKIEEIPDEMDGADEEPKKVKSVEVALTEKILSHCVHLVSSNNTETKILALKTASCGFKVLQDDEDTLLPLVHQLWSPLVSRLTGDYSQNLELSLCAFECLVAMAVTAKDFIKRRTLDLIIPRLCLFLESQSTYSKGKKEYGPYCMTIAYKSQLRILNHLGSLAYHIQLAYSSLWRVVKVTLLYLDSGQVPPLRRAAHMSLHYMIALDADCVWYFAKQAGQLKELPFELVYDENSPQDQIIKGGCGSNNRKSGSLKVEQKPLAHTYANLPVSRRGCDVIA